MRILICHNYYQQRGGEDNIFAAEAEMLRCQGHEVNTFTVHNDAVNKMSKARLALATIWNRASAKKVSNLVRQHRAEIVHFHNTFPLFSPAVYHAARGAGAAVVQSLHNYRLLCPAATFFREGKPCEKCLGKLPVMSVIHGCYRQSSAASAACMAMLGIHRAIGTYRNCVDAYILAISEFARAKFVQGGLDSTRIFHKPNFLDPDPGAGKGDGGFALFVGRLTEEKGIAPLLAAWKIIGSRIPLVICGDGPMSQIVADAARRQSGIDYRGRVELSEVIELMGRASALIFPSLWYEGFPRTIVEAYARGTPVIASELGAMADLIEPGKTGTLFKPGDAVDLSAKILELFSSPQMLAAMRQPAREKFVSHYTAVTNYPQLLAIYQSALNTRHAIRQ